MKVNNKKTKLMYVNVREPRPLVFNEMMVECCDRYTYLGNPIMNAPIYKQVEDHIKSHAKSLHKFQSFLPKNTVTHSNTKRHSYLYTLQHIVTLTHNIKYKQCNTY